jgi:hypothetical protein
MKQEKSPNKAPTRLQHIPWLIAPELMKKIQETTNIKA